MDAAGGRRIPPASDATWEAKQPIARRLGGRSGGGVLPANGGRATAQSSPLGSPLHWPPGNGGGAAHVPARTQSRRAWPARPFEPPPEAARGLHLLADWTAMPCLKSGDVLRHGRPGSHSLGTSPSRIASLDRLSDCLFDGRSHDPPQLASECSPPMSHRRGCPAPPGSRGYCRQLEVSTIVRSKRSHCRPRRWLCQSVADHRRGLLDVAVHHLAEMRLYSPAERGIHARAVDLDRRRKLRQRRPFVAVLPENCALPHPAPCRRQILADDPRWRWQNHFHTS